MDNLSPNRTQLFVRNKYTVFKALSIASELCFRHNASGLPQSIAHLELVLRSLIARTNIAPVDRKIRYLLVLCLVISL